VTSAACVVGMTGWQSPRAGTSKLHSCAAVFTSQMSSRRRCCCCCFSCSL